MGNCLGKPREDLEIPQEEDHASSFTCVICIKKKKIMPQRKPRELALEIPHQEEDDHGSASFTCAICVESTSSSKKFINTNFCKHPFCQDCIAKYIQAKIQGHTAKIECPEPSCQYHLDPLICRPMLSETLFSTWCDLLCEDSLLGSEKSYCPNRNCLALVLNECRGDVKKSMCPNCKQLFCFKCKTVWHAGCKCKESDQARDRNDVLFEHLIEEKMWIRCPGCGQCVERLQGCTFMRCRCKTRFCYHCGRKVSSNNGCGCRHSWSNRMHLQHPQNLQQLLNPQNPQNPQNPRNLQRLLYPFRVFFIAFSGALFLLLLTLDY